MILSDLLTHHSMQGHTVGSLSLYAETYGDDGHRGEDVIFTGDLIAGRPPYEIVTMKEEEQQHPGSKMTGFKAHNRGGFEIQKKSLQALMDEKWPFQWILPGEWFLYCIQLIVTFFHLNSPRKNDAI